jgi:MFS family permease
VADKLLHVYGHRVTFLTLAIAVAILVLPTLFFIKPRLPAARTISTPPLKKPYLYKPIFWIFLAMNTLQGAASFLPVIYTPVFAAAENINHTLGTLVLAIMQVASVLGLLAFGWGLENLHLRSRIALSTIGSAVSVLVLWGFAAHIAPLILFGITFGLTAGGFTALWPHLVSLIIGEDQRLHTQMLTIFSASRGIGTILSGPFSSILLQIPGFKGAGRIPYGLKGLGPLILFIGIILLMSAIGALYDKFGGVSRKSRSEEDDSKESKRGNGFQLKPLTMVDLAKPTAAFLKHPKLH